MKSIKTQKDFVLEIAYTILFFPILGENIISTMLGDTISKLLSVLTCAIILVSACMNKKVKLTKFIITLFLLVMLRVVITFVFRESSTSIDISNNMITPYGLIGYMMLCIFLDLYLNNQKQLSVIFKSMMIIMTISVFVNFFITGDLTIADNVAVFREALSTGYTNSRKWLFGHRNMIFIHHLMWILFSYVSYKIDDRDYNKIFIFQMGFTMLVAIVSWNSTMMLVTAVLFILFMFKDTVLAKINVWYYLLLYLFLEIGIVFFRIQEVFSFIIEDILHRNLSFTGRTTIWNYYIEQFIDAGIVNKLFGNFGATSLQVNSHNMFLGLLSFTGMVGLFLFAILIIFSATNLYKEKNTDIAKVVSIILFCFLINSLTMEFYLQPLTALYFAYSIKSINSNCIDGGNTKA